ncbi:uncharacterized protein BXZ73DRAFT_111254 [Epithele typhae]|uniref:uncharacterized protein n=1 Tax=Epithele typhae TaxID=378194 RepID=UPI0020074AC0|nr:uncharacterized protein BXZ73DRAFT_111254 [Epithele typhae]KAH9904239.1 hypothetical protein BXZ73DRAFT_111254 [Epithele typhae]
MGRITPLTPAVAAHLASLWEVTFTSRQLVTLQDGDWTFPRSFAACRALRSLTIDGFCLVSVPTGYDGLIGPSGAYRSSRTSTSTGAQAIFVCAQLEGQDYAESFIRASVSSLPRELHSFAVYPESIDVQGDFEFLCEVLPSIASNLLQEIIIGLPILDFPEVLSLTSIKYAARKLDDCLSTEKFATLTHVQLVNKASHMYLFSLKQIERLLPEVFKRGIVSLVEDTEWRMGRTPRLGRLGASRRRLYH